MQVVGHKKKDNYMYWDFILIVLTKLFIKWDYIDLC